MYEEEYMCHLHNTCCCFFLNTRFIHNLDINWTIIIDCINCFYIHKFWSTQVRLKMVCLFVWGFSSHSRIFHSYEDVTIAGKGLQFSSSCARHSWPLCSESSLPCHTYCYTGHPFIMVISEDPWNSHLLLSV